MCSHRSRKVVYEKQVLLTQPGLSKILPLSAGFLVSTDSLEVFPSLFDPTIWEIYDERWREFKDNLLPYKNVRVHVLKRKTITVKYRWANGGGGGAS